MHQPSEPVQLRVIQQLLAMEQIPLDDNDQEGITLLFRKYPEWSAELIKRIEYLLSPFN